MKRDGWKESIVEAFKNLGGKAHRKDLAEEVGRIRKSKGLSWDNVENPIQSVQERVQAYSSAEDSRHYKEGRPHLFKKTNPGTRDGLWELRDIENVEQTLNDINYYDNEEEFISISSDIDKEVKLSEGKKTKKEHEVRERNQLAVKQCKQRDNFVCQSCGFNFNNMLVEAHHLTPQSNYDGEYEISKNDLITLCPTCHRIAHYLINHGLENCEQKEILIRNIRNIKKQEN